MSSVARLCCVFMVALAGSFAEAAEAPVPAASTTPDGPGWVGAPPQQTAVLPALPAATLDNLQQQDPAKSNGQLQVGVSRALPQPLAVNRSAAPAAEWTVLPDGWRIWSVSILSPGALGIRLHLQSIALPEGVRLIVYDPANPAPDPVPITAQTLTGTQEHWTQTLFTEQVILQCQVPPGVDAQAVAFTVTGLSHLYRLPFPSPDILQKEGTCHRDVTCFPAFAQEASGVARIAYVVGGNAFVCSGCLIATDPSVSGNFFLTANHCVANQSQASSLELFWFFQTSTCNGTPPTLDSVPTTTGADLIATSTANDFTFLRLRQAPPAGTFHLPWSTNTPTAGETLTCIHHPGGAYKRISQGRFVGSSPGFWGVQWFTGVTEDGSSGSPLLNGNHQIIGQLNSGFNGPGSSCANPTAPDQFGRFDLTYNSIKQYLSGSSGGGGGGGGGGGSNPVSVPAGTYNGLFADSANGISALTAGSISVTATSKARFNGRLTMGPGRYSFSGQFDDSGSAQVTINRRLQGPLTVQLQLDPADSDHLIGTVTDGSFNATVSADRGVFNTRTNPAPQAGQYTMLIPGHSDPTVGPDGNSYGTVTVDKSGRVSFAAALADGTRVSESTVLSKNGQWPLFLPLYKNQGLIWGQITLASTSTGDLSGNVTWIKPNQPATKVFPSGFSGQSTVTGSAYQRPTKGAVILDLSQANLTLSGGDLSSQIKDLIALNANNRVVDLSSNKLSMTFSVSSGMFSGRLLAPGSTKKYISFSGVVLQNQNAAGGYFLDSNQSGSVSIGP